jgi:hypothetical protein
MPSASDVSGEVAPALVVQDRVHVARKVRHDEIEPSIVVVVGGVRAHPRLGHSLAAQGRERLHPDVLEGSVAAIAPEEVGNAVVGDVDVLVSVVVVVERDDAERVERRVERDARGARDVGERAVPVVAVERVLGGHEPEGAAVDRDPSQVARDPRRRLLRAARGHGRPVQLDVAGHVQIEVAVRVHVEPGRRRPPRRVADAGARRDVRERAVAVVPVQNVRSQVGHVEVRIAVVVVVARRDAVAPSTVAGARTLGDVREASLAVSAKEPVRLTLVRRAIVGGAVDEVEIELPVEIEVEPCRSRAHRLREPQLLARRGAALVAEHDAGSGRGVHEPRHGRRRGSVGRLRHGGYDAAGRR